MSSGRVGSDIGGTFTDLVVLDEDTGKLGQIKVPTTPDAPELGLVAGLRRALDQRPDQRIRRIEHGTTIATNTLIQGRGARCALVTTAGFRDVLEIARQQRPHLYDAFQNRARPLVPRRLRLEVPERTRSDGSVHRPLDLVAARQVARRLHDEGVEAIAVCFLFSHLNPQHELDMRRLIHEECPAAFVTLSAEVLPEYREFERTSTTVVNAYIGPVVDRYVKALEEQIGAIGIRADVGVMQSNGGIMTAAAARHRPAAIVESGPAAGVIAALFFGQLAGYTNLITFDMGGTTTKASLVDQGQPTMTTEYEVATHGHSGGRGWIRGVGYPLRMPSLDISEIGAGGGSIAWLDTGGALKVGPQSAGAAPGPACYGTGGTEPTVTDANLLLGRLNPAYFLGGEMPVYPQLAREAFQPLGQALGKDAFVAANGVIQVANSNMERAARVVSVARGYDPRDFSMVAFGGAGPLHAAQLARQLGIPRVIVPPMPGLLSAFGLLVADFRADFVVTTITEVDSRHAATMEQIFHRLEETARDRVTADGLPLDQVVLKRSADMRYVGQNYEINVPLNGSRLDPASLDTLKADFHRRHDAMYGHSAPAEPVQIINWRVTAVGLTQKPAIAEIPLASGQARRALKERRPVYDAATGQAVETPIYDRGLLGAGSVVEGPAIVEQPDSTTVILPSQRATVDRYGSLIIDV